MAFSRKFGILILPVLTGFLFIEDSKAVLQPKSTKHHFIVASPSLSNHILVPQTRKPSYSVRVKRGLILSKIKKLKSGIWSAKTKLWRIKKKAIEILLGRDETPKQQYESTGESWGSSKRVAPKSVPLLSHTHGPPYSASTPLRSLRSNGSSVKLSHADLMAIYALPFHKKQQ